MRMLLLFYAVFLLSPAEAESLTANYFRPDQIVRFADHLYRQRDYLRAAGEYQRYLFSFDSLPGNADSVHFRIGACYRKAGFYQQAIDQYRIVRSLPTSNLMMEAVIQTAFCYYLAGEYDSTMVSLTRPDSTDWNPELWRRAQELLSVNYIMKRDWPAARSLVHTMEQNPFTQELISFLAEHEHLPRKNMYTAGLLSAVVPGLGKLYCRRAYDAFSSFSSIAILGWQAYDGFHDDGTSSVKGWIFSVIGGIFYLGNIYGSIVAADLYNEEGELTLINRIQARVYVHFD